MGVEIPGRLRIGDSVTYKNDDGKIKLITVSNDDGFIRVYINGTLKHIQDERKSQDHKGRG